MCIVLRGQDGVVEQARRQLEDLVSFAAAYTQRRSDPTKTKLMFRSNVLAGPRMGCSRLHPHANDRAGAPALQSLDPRTRVL